MSSPVTTICGVQYQVQFEKVGPKLKLTPVTSSGVALEGRLECYGCNFATFAFGGPAICTDPRDEENKGCGNIFKMKVEFECCPIGKWDGEGWYCIKAAGANDSTCVAAELLETDKCDHTIEICSGPYADQVTAQVHCGPVIPQYAPTCCGAPVSDINTFYSRSVAAGEVVDEYWRFVLPAGSWTFFGYIVGTTNVSVGTRAGPACDNITTTFFIHDLTGDWKFTLTEESTVCFHIQRLIAQPFDWGYEFSVSAT